MTKMGSNKTASAGPVLQGGVSEPIVLTMRFRRVLAAMPDRAQKLIDELHIDEA